VVCQLRSLTEDFQKDESTDLALDNKLIDDLLVELFEGKERELTYDIGVIFINLSFHSQTLCKYFLDPYIMKKIYTLANDKNMNVVENVIALLSNLILEAGNTIENFINMIPIVNKLKTLLESSVTSIGLKFNCISLLRQITEGIGLENYQIVKFLIFNAIDP
jgi:hypothetical protein